MADKKLPTHPVKKTLFVRSTSAIQKNDSSALSRTRSYNETQIPRENRSGSIIALEELVQCGICLDKLIEPRMLPCQHTFCMSCLRAHLLASAGRKSGKSHVPYSLEKIQTTIANTDTEIRCPTCQIPVQIFNGFEGLQQLPSNVYIDSLLKVLNGSSSPLPQTPTRCSAEVRCVKCQTVCQFENENCRHCKQIFCQVCWTEHLSVLKNNLGTLLEHLQESETCLDHRVQDFHEYCDKLKVDVGKAAEEKILEIKAKQQESLKHVDDIKKREENGAATLKERVIKFQKEIKELKFEGIVNGKQKVDIFMNFHNSTSKILNEISHVGDVRLGFDQQTLKIKQNNELFERGISRDECDVTDFKNINNPLESIDTMSTYYLSRRFIPKLVWTKCPRPAGLAIPPWAPNLLYIAATDRKVVLIMDRGMSKIIGKLSATEMLCPHSVAFSNDSSEIYVTDKWRHCIHTFSREGDYLRTLCCLGSGAGELRSPEGIAVNQKNELVVCDTGNDRVVVLDPLDGQHIFTFGMVDKRTELQAPTGVAVYENKIIIADNGNHRIKVFSTDGKKLLEFGSFGTNKGQFRTAEIVTCDLLGFILVGDAGNSRIQVFRPDGSLIRVLGSYGETPGKFAWISGLLVTPQLEIIVTDYKNRRLQIF